MLVCSECNTENTDQAKYCIKCGTSLTEKHCHQCNAKVPYELEHCPVCNAFTATTCWAIICYSLPPKITEDSPTRLQEETQEEELTKLKIKLLAEKEYLDPENRYRLMSKRGELPEVFLQEYNYRVLFQTKVIDTKPVKKSSFQQAIENSAEPLWSQTKIPEIALPYLDLKNKLPREVIAPIYDAWEENELGVVLLADISQWKSISSASQEQMPAQRIIYYILIMTELWQELSPIQYRQSLLEVENLRLDENENLYLQQLYPELPAEEPSLMLLGKIWENLFLNNTELYHSELKRIIREVATGKINSTDDLYSRWQQLSDEEEENTMPDPQGIINSNPYLQEAEESQTNEIDEQPTVVLPMQLLSLSEAACTDIGSQRDHNEDYFGIVKEIKKQEQPNGTKYQAKGLYILCDGMGGHAAGEVASSMAVESLKEYFQTNLLSQLPTRSVIEEGILLTNETIYTENINKGRSGHGRMGTTLVMAIVQDTQAAMAHVGDSRIYRITRRGGVEQITQDHSVAQQAIRAGMNPEKAFSRPDAYQLTQALGPRDNNQIQPEIQFIDLREDTLLLLCSDGFSDNDFVETQAKPYLINMISSKVNLEQELRNLVDLANEHNGHDNITALVVRIKVQPSLEAKA